MLQCFRDFVLWSQYIGEVLKLTWHRSYTQVRFDTTYYLIITLNQTTKTATAKLKLSLQWRDKFKLSCGERQIMKQGTIISMLPMSVEDKVIRSSRGWWENWYKCKQRLHHADGTLKGGHQGCNIIVTGEWRNTHQYIHWVQLRCSQKSATCNKPKCIQREC